MDSPARPFPRRWAPRMIALSVALFALYFLVAANPWRLVVLYESFNALVLLLLAAVLLAAVAVVLVAAALHEPARRRGGPLAVVALGAAAAAAVLGIMFFGMLASWVIDQPEDIRQTVESPDGRHRAVTTEWIAMFDHGWAVYVEDRRGLLSRRERVWMSLECPVVTDVTFTGATSLEVRGSDGKAYALDFDAESLRATPSYDVAQPAGCSD